MKIYFTNGTIKIIDGITDFTFRDTYLWVKTDGYEGAIYIPLYNVLYIERE